TSRPLHLSRPFSDRAASCISATSAGCSSSNPALGRDPGAPGLLLAAAGGQRRAVAGGQRRGVTTPLACGWRSGPMACLACSAGCEAAARLVSRPPEGCGRRASTGWVLTRLPLMCIDGNEYKNAFWYDMDQVKSVPCVFGELSHFYVQNVGSWTWSQYGYPLCWTFICKTRDFFVTLHGICRKE
ncbi:unnamed protein product, partial [Urochloa humidicola]